MRWYVPHLERLHDDAGVRRGDIEQLARLAAGYGSRERFLTEEWPAVAERIERLGLSIEDLLQSKGNK